MNCYVIISIGFIPETAQEYLIPLKELEEAFQSRLETVGEGSTYCGCGCVVTVCYCVPLMFHDPLVFLGLPTALLHQCRVN